MAEFKNTTISDTGFIEIPAGTTAQRPGSPNLAAFRFNTDEGWFEIWTGAEWATVASASRDPVSLTNTMDTPDGLWVPGDTVTYTKVSPPADTFSPASVTFPVRNGGEFRIKLYGGSGGATSNPGNFGGNSNGNIVDAQLNLTSYQDSNLYFYLGGSGQNSTGGIDGSTGRPYGRAGQNGGGRGAGTRGPSGGGRTDLRVNSGDVFSELLVAGGGGGGGGSRGTSGTRYQGQDGRAGFTGSFPYDNGGGGGGYFGGNGSQEDDGSNGGRGSNYTTDGSVVTVFQNTETNGTSGGNQGNGYFELTVISVV